MPFLILVGHIYNGRGNPPAESSIDSSGLLPFMPAAGVPVFTLQLLDNV